MLAIAGDTTYTSMNRCEVMRVNLNVLGGVENPEHTERGSKRVGKKPDRTGIYVCLYAYTQRSFG